MKRTRIFNILLALIFLVVGVLGSGQIISAASNHVLKLKNASFETGNQYGWDKNLPSSAATASVVTTYAFSQQVMPKYGRYFAYITPDQPGVYTKLSQTMTANEGDIISGWANFCSLDYAPYNDNAQVVIKDGSNNELAVVFSANSDSLGSGIMTGWTYFEYEFTTPGVNTYILEARVANFEDSQNSSPLCLDGVNTNTPVTAEAGGTDDKYYVTQGETLQLSGSGTDPTGGALNYKWDLNGDGIFETQGQNPVFSATGLSAPQVLTVTLQATNQYYDPESQDPRNANFIATDTAHVNIQAIPFAVVINPVASPITLGDVLRGTGFINNPASGSTYIVQLDYGDGSGLNGIQFSSGYTFNLDHTYTAAGTYIITVVAEDITLGGTASAAAEVTVIPGTPDTYSLTINVTPSEGGSVEVSQSGPYYLGDIVTLTAVSAEGYTFTSWGSNYGTDPMINISFEGNTVIEANFEPVQSQTTYYSLTLNADNSQGSISVSSPVEPVSSQYPDGTVLELTAVPAAGYTFSNWTGDLNGSANPASLTINSNKLVTANFAKIVTYTLNINSNNTIYGTVTTEPQQLTYAAGTPVKITATAKTGYTFTGWSGDLAGTTNPAIITMTSNKVVTATFAKAEPVYQATNFVIWGGNKANLTDAIKVGQTVNCWGSQWEKQITAGAFYKNASFKGWANGVSADGKSWTTDPGNSSNPPATISKYISVLVSTNIAKKGSVISGNVVATVILEVDNPGSYQPNPGHPITGKVVSITLK